METTKNSSNEKEEKKPFNIKVLKPADFDPCAEVHMGSSKDLSVLINGVFASAYDDYIGCNLVCTQIPNYGPAIIPYLYFKLFPVDFYKKKDENDDGSDSGKKEIVTAFKPVNVKTEDFLSKLTLLSTPSLTPNKMVDMTQDGMEGLYEFMPRSGNGKVEWGRYYSVKTFPNDPETYICLSGTGNSALLKKVYGYVDEEGSSLEYQVIPVRPLTTDQNAVLRGEIQNWGLHILRLKNKPLDRAAESFGMIMSGSNSVPMVKAVRN